MPESFEYMTEGEKLNYHLWLAEEKMKCPGYAIKWYSWIHTFGTTSGPRGGIAGQAFTSFRVYGFENLESGEKLKYCAGVWAAWDGKAEGWK